MSRTQDEAMMTRERLEKSDLERWSAMQGKDNGEEETFLRATLKWT